MFRKLGSGSVSMKLVTITVDRVDIPVEEGEPIAAVLLRGSAFTTRVTPVSGSARAPYCMMGACFECLMEIDGEPSTRSCVTPARNGSIARRQVMRPDPMRDIGT